ncbi:glycosyltransferase [Salinisphaera shabanensis T35B1]|uniref:glycosyltransferase family 4 protein n=1 Tax=Salinisphaera shabanensis TaxID=180542 RepID=UPI0033404CF9
MKLLFILGNAAGRGGTERVTCELANAFAGAANDVEILSPFGRNEAYFALSPSVKVTCLGLLEARGRLGRFGRISWALYRYCLRSKPDVVLVVDTIQFMFCLPWFWCLRAHFVCWEHFNLTTEHGSRFRTMARVAAAWWSDAIVVLTERDARAWRQRFAIGYRVQAIWNPIPRFDTRPSALAERSRIVLAVGRLTEQKGFDVLLRAWQQLSDSREDWILRIVGSGKDDAMLKRLARDLGVSESVVFVGQTKAVASEYRAASLYVMSSRWEGLPMTLLEAQYFGLPSIATDCPTGPREVLSGGSGWLVEPGDPRALSKGLAELLSRPEKRAEMSSAALENARRYVPEEIRSKWERLFERLGVAAENKSGETGQ